MLDAVAETVDGHIVGTFLCGQPYVMDVTQNGTFYLPARVDVVHVGIEDGLEHHLRVIGTTTAFSVQFLEILQIKTFDYGIDNAHRVVFRYVIVGIDCQKQPVVIVVSCM